MDWDDYFRQQATMYRELAQKTEYSFIKQELLELAAVCEEVANNIEDRQPVLPALVRASMQYSNDQREREAYECHPDRPGRCCWRGHWCRDCRCVSPHRLLAACCGRALHGRWGVPHPRD